MIIILAGLIIGLAKGGLLGPVAGALILPLLSQTMTVSQAVGVTLPLLMFADVFAIINLIKLPGFLAAGIMDVHLLGRVIWALPVIPFGVWLGRLGVGRMNPRFCDSLMTILLFLAGLFLLFK